MSTMRLSALTSIGASAASAAALFVVFRLTVEVQSTTLIGCWALLQGLFMVARVADIGVGNNVTRLVAVQQSEGTPFSKFRIGAASVLITSLPVSIICALIYWPITTFVQHRYSSELPRSDIAVLAASCAVFAVTSSVSTILLAILEDSESFRPRMEF